MFFDIVYAKEINSVWRNVVISLAKMTKIFEKKVQSGRRVIHLFFWYLLNCARIGHERLCFCRQKS